MQTQPRTAPYSMSTHSDFGSQMHAWARTHLHIADSAMAGLPRVYVIGTHVPQVG